MRWIALPLALLFTACSPAREPPPDVEPAILYASETLLLPDSATVERPGHQPHDLNQQELTALAEELAVAMELSNTQPGRGLRRTAPEVIVTLTYPGGDVFVYEVLTPRLLYDCTNDQRWLLTADWKPSRFLP